jgi:hypothetical protein
MKKGLLWMAVVVLAALVAAPAGGEEKEKKANKKRERQNPALTGLVKQLESAELTDDQKAKVKEIAKGYEEKLAAIAKERAALLGEDGQQKMAAARKEAQESGKKGKEMQDAILAALELNEEQAAQYQKLQAGQQELMLALRKEVASVLTAEQIEKAGLNPRRGAKPKTDK